MAIAVARGDLRFVPDKAAVQASVETDHVPRPRRSGEPVVVRPERSGRPEPAGTAVIAGRVLDARGFLVVGAEVSARGLGTLRTDADGVFHASVPLATALPLFVRHPGHRARWIVPSLQSPDPLLVQLDPAAPWDVETAAPAAAGPALTGEGIVRGADGRPLAGAYVTAAGSSAWSRTDDIGRYVLPLSGPQATLVVHHPGAGAGGFAARSEPLTFDRASGALPLPELTAAPAAAIRGTLRDGRGNPLAGVPVQLRGEGLERVFESGSGGVFRIAGLLPGSYELRPFAWRGAAGRRQQVAVDRPVVDCELQLAPLEDRRLRVLDEHGTPLGRAYVAATVDGARQSVAQTDADGWAAVSVGLGDVQFEVRPADGSAAMPVRRYESEQARLVVSAP